MSYFEWSTILFVALGSLLIATSITRAGDVLFIGTNKGVFSTSLDTTTGKLSEPKLAFEIRNPSFLAQHPTLNVLYAVSETYDGKARVYALSIDAISHALTEISSQEIGVDADASGPCFVSATDSALLVANYGSGSVVSFPLDENGVPGARASHIKHTGSSVNASRQKEPHAHSITPAPVTNDLNNTDSNNADSNNADSIARFAVAADLGTDELIVYAIDAKSAVLTPHSVAKLTPGAGPRHVAFHPTLPILFVCGELDNTLCAFAWDARAGTLSARTNVGSRVSTLPPDFIGSNSTAEVAVHPSGKFVYVSNCGHDSIARFTFDSTTQSLSLVSTTPTQGKKPRHFSLNPSGQWMVVANQTTGNLVVFAVDQATGELRSINADDQAILLDSPQCVRFIRGQ